MFFFHNHICLRIPNFDKNVEFIYSRKFLPVFQLVSWVFPHRGGLFVSEFHISETWKPLVYPVLVEGSFIQHVDLQPFVGLPIKWVGQRGLADLAFELCPFRLVPCHSQPGHQCPHQHQCDLWWEGAWDVLQTRGACARPTCSTCPVPGLWW